MSPARAYVERRKIVVHLDADLHAAASDVAARQDRSITQIVEYALRIALPQLAQAPTHRTPHAQGART